MTSCCRCCLVQIFSCFLPPVNLIRTSSWAKENDDKSFSFDDSAILIKRGKLIHGECAVQGTSVHRLREGVMLRWASCSRVCCSLSCLAPRMSASTARGGQAQDSLRTLRPCGGGGLDPFSDVVCCPARTGCLCKKTLGTAGGGLVHTVWNELGPDVTRYTINNIQFTVNHWLLQVRAAQRGVLCILGRDYPGAAFLSRQRFLQNKVL